MINARDQIRSIQNADKTTEYVTTVGTFDGAYQQRSGKSGSGFSRSCFAAAITAETGKVISYEVGCNSCAVCTRINDRYLSNSIKKEQCEIQKEDSKLSSVHLKSAIGPKVIAGALERGVIFSAIVSDGDNKTHDALGKDDIYHNIPGSPSIDRFECIAHVAKRMKSNLFKRQEKVLKLSRADKASKSREMAKKDISKAVIKKLFDKEYRGRLQRSSKGRESWQSGASLEIKHLSLSMCAQIASYYRLAVQRNSGDVPAILNAIRAIPLHLSANDENAEQHHIHCPFTSDSWCRFQSSKFNGQPIPTHPNYFGEEDTDLILELFHDFGYDTAEFVTKVSTGLSSNHNESPHNLLFTMAPKTDAIGLDVMMLASALAVIRYNEGFNGIQRLFQKLDIEITDRMRHCFLLADSSRARQKVKIVPAQKMRYRKKQGRGRTHVKQKSKHGPGYAFGSYIGAISSKPHSETSSDDDFEEETRLVAIGLGLKFIEEELDWVGCDKWRQWFHTLCVDIEDADDLGATWYYSEC